VPLGGYENIAEFAVQTTPPQSSCLLDGYDKKWQRLVAFEATKTPLRQPSQGLRKM